MCSGGELAMLKILPHAHLQYVCNTLAKYLKDTLNALGGVDFTRYALSVIIQYVQWLRIV